MPVPEKIEMLPISEGFSLLDVMERLRQQVRQATGLDQVYLQSLPERNRSWVREALEKRVASEPVFWGIDMASKSSVSVEMRVSPDGVHWREVETAAPVVLPRPRRPAFPNPEAVAWRPKL